MSYPTVELREWQAKIFRGLKLAPKDQKLIDQLGGEEGRLQVDELLSGVRISARSWVGVVHFSNFGVRIIPKLAGENLDLVKMLALTTDIDALKRNVGVRHLKLEEAGSLFDLIAMIFAEACERVASAGLMHDYVVEEADLPTLRGRLLVDRQVLHRFGRVDRLECRFDYHCSDILENQLLALALEVCRLRVSHPIVRQRIHRLYNLFMEACSISGFDLEDALQRLSYNRLNEYYRDAHDLARLILEGFGIKDLFAAADVQSFAFLLDMNRLFEVFAFRYIQNLLKGEAYRIQYQHKERSIIWNTTENQPYASVIPDLIIEAVPSTSRRLVIDAKYKPYDEHKINSSDIYQSFLYAYAFNSLKTNVPEALLVYPASFPLTSPVRLSIRSSPYLVGARIYALGIHIPQAIHEIEEGISGPISKTCMEIVERSLHGVATLAGEITSAN